MAPYTRNSVLFLAALCLTVVAWFLGNPLWMRAFVLERTFSSGTGWSLTFFGAIWGYDFLLSLAVGCGLAYFIGSSHRVRWAIAFGTVLCAAHAAFFLPKVVYASDWSDYVTIHAGLVVPLVGAALGGRLAAWLRSKERRDVVA